MEGCGVCFILFQIFARAIYEGSSDRRARSLTYFIAHGPFQ